MQDRDQEGFSCAKDWEDIALRVEPVIDDDAIIDRLATRAFKNKSDMPVGAQKSHPASVGASILRIC